MSSAAKELEQYCDISFMVGGRLIKASKFNLAKVSSVFRIQFGSAWSNPVIAEAIPVDDAQHELFATMVNYANFPESFDLLITMPTATVDSVYDLLLLADRYEVRKLVRICEMFLGDRLANSNVIRLYMITNVVFAPHLNHHCVSYLIDKRLEDMQHFEEMSNELVGELVRAIWRMSSNN